MVVPFEFGVGKLKVGRPWPTDPLLICLGMQVTSLQSRGSSTRLVSSCRRIPILAPITSICWLSWARPTLDWEELFGPEMRGSYRLYCMTAAGLFLVGDVKALVGEHPTACVGEE